MLQGILQPEQTQEPDNCNRCLPGYPPGRGHTPKKERGASWLPGTQPLQIPASSSEKARDGSAPAALPAAGAASTSPTNTLQSSEQWGDWNSLGWWELQTGLFSYLSSRSKKKKKKVQKREIQRTNQEGAFGVTFPGVSRTTGWRWWARTLLTWVLLLCLFPTAMLPPEKSYYQRVPGLTTVLQWS